MIEPDVASSFDDIDLNGANDPFDAIIIGTGDREDPFNKSVAVVDDFYTIKDRGLGNRVPPKLISTAGTLSLPAPASVLATISFPATATQTPTGDPLTLFSRVVSNRGTNDVNLAHGWKVSLPAGDEKVVGRPVTIGGIILFTTYSPTPANATSICTPSAGTGRLWALGLNEGEIVLDLDDPSGDGNLEPYAALSTPGIPPPVVPVGIGDTATVYSSGRQNPLVDTKFRIGQPTYWRREEQ
jgi:type IV pilus assembly protein PilY1